MKLFSFTLICFLGIVTETVIALPPPEDIPEEVLSEEIILEAKSPVDNKPLTPSEYAQLKEEMQKSPFPPQIDSELRHNIFLLRILKLIRTITFLN